MRHRLCPRVSEPTFNKTRILGPLVVPDDEEIANERPTAAELVDAVGEDSTIFASEQADVDEVVEIERIEIVEVVEPGHNDFLKKRRSIIIASMAVGCFILFALSVLISSRVSCICSKPDRVSVFQIDTSSTALSANKIGAARPSANQKLI